MNSGAINCGYPFPPLNRFHVTPVMFLLLLSRVVNCAVHSSSFPSNSSMHLFSVVVAVVYTYGFGVRQVFYDSVFFSMSRSILHSPSFCSFVSPFRIFVFVLFSLLTHPSLLSPNHAELNCGCNFALFSSPFFAARQLCVFT
mmetsp:Transcript_37751/g.97391  ORF Transcript_37751/g.97391 Transcript_37751/m.97391 type:complete len:142 (+) Transcript_37751:828-1253(+)